MKLLIAIVNNDDSAVVSSSLTKEGFTVTKLSTTGGFLMVGNTTFLIGAEDDSVAKAKAIIKEYSQKLKYDLNKNYSVRLLYKMLKYYNFISSGKLPTVSAKLSWSHYDEILSLDSSQKINY